MSLRIFLPGLIVILSGLAFGQDTKKDSFEDLLARAKESDPDVDFTALRMAFTQTPNYDPYEDNSDSRKELRSALKEKNFESVIKQADALLSSNFVDIAGHGIAAIAHAELKNDEKAKFHTNVRDGLLQSILKSGDGKSPKTAFVVISTSEEYALMASLRIRSLEQSLIQEDGHQFDEHLGEDQEGKAVTLYFNIDRPMEWLADSLKKKD